MVDQEKAPKKAKFINFKPKPRCKLISLKAKCYPFLLKANYSFTPGTLKLIFKPAYGIHQ